MTRAERQRRWEKNHPQEAAASRAKRQARWHKARNFDRLASKIAGWPRDDRNDFFRRLDLAQTAAYNAAKLAERTQA